MTATSALSLALGGIGTVISLTAKDNVSQDVGGALLLTGSILFAVSTTITRFIYGDYRGGTVSCCIKGGACGLLVGSTYLSNGDEYNLASAGGFALSSLGCLAQSVYDAMSVYNLANMRVKTVEIVRFDTLYDTLKIVERDTVVVVKKVERHRYRRRITPKDREKARREYNLGLEAYARDDLEGALRHFKRALRYDPTFEKAREAVRRLENRLRGVR